MEKDEKEIQNIRNEMRKGLNEMRLMKKAMTIRLEALLGGQQIQFCL